MLSDEEKQAIERLNIYKDKIKDELYPIIDFEEEKAIGIILNLIEKQSKEIEELKEDSCCMTNCVRRGKEKLFLEDKIKALIEERNKWLQEYDEQEEMNELQKDDYRLIKVERYILQSLLEKE